MRMRAHLITSLKSRSRGLGSTGQVVKRKNCTRSRGQGSFSAVKNLDRGRKRSYGKHRSDRPLSLVQQVCNAIVETVPDAMKLGVVRPIYKGGGRDPLDTNSYRGITLSSVLSKTLELLLLRRFQETLSESQFPHLNQTGFVKKTSCADAIFSSYELTSCLTRSGNAAYICFFDLQKAFDTVQYPILLNCVFSWGINGKAWRLLDSWYTEPKCRVKVNGRLSQTICLERGVLQGSILSPTLFLMVMDPLLRKLEQCSLGPCLGDLYCGAYAHADDIRTIVAGTHWINKYQWSSLSLSQTLWC